MVFGFQGSGFQGPEEFGFFTYNRLAVDSARERAALGVVVMSIAPALILLVMVVVGDCVVSVMVSLMATSAMV